MSANSSNVAVPFTSNPEYTGPGLWFWLHLKSYHATTYEKAIAFIEDLWLLAANHPCPNCRKHMTAYLINNPPRDHTDYIDEQTGRNVGMFRYTWMFHNDVNLRLGKPTMSFEMAISQFEKPDEITPCTDGCGSDSDDEPIPLSPRNHPGIERFLTPNNNSKEITIKPSIVTKRPSSYSTRW